MNIGEVTDIIGYCDKVGTVPLINGKHGIGKSQITMQYAKSNNMHCEQLILSLMDTADLLGLPVASDVGGTTSVTWAAPSWHSRIVNAAWPVELDVSKLVFNDKEFEEFFNKNTKKDFYMNRAELNALYCSYKNLPSDSLHLLTQNLVNYKDSKRSVLFLDEFNRAPSDILNASLQLILDKRLNDHVLPVVNGQPTLVVAAINPDNEEYTVNSLDPALLDRFLYLDVEVDYKEWLSYARSAGVHSVITDFITEHTDKLHFESLDGTVGATPRSWSGLSKFLDVADTIPKEHLFPLIKGMIGPYVGAEFVHFYNNYSTAVKFSDVDKKAKQLLKKHKNDVELSAADIAKAITDKQESIQQMELVEQFYDKYIEEPQEKALPLLVFLYSMPIEQATAFITSTKKVDPSLTKFGELDAYTNKKLLKEILMIARKANK